MLEAEVAKVGDVEEGTMRAVQVGKTKVLLARVDGGFHAVGAKCPHYGAPLPEGALCGTRVICPWHHASFDVRTGDLLEPPAFDSLPVFPVRVDGDRILVSVPEDPVTRRTPPMAKRDAALDERTAVILGGGAAGYMAAQTLREDGFRGRVILITREDRLPYDRPNLSKDYLQGKAQAEWMPLRSEAFFAEHDIEVLLGKEAVRLDTAGRLITFRDGQSLPFDMLLAATGGAPRPLTVPRAAIRNVFLLRSFADADAIIAAAVGVSTSRSPANGDDATAAPVRVVVIGASFIGMEVAGSLATRKCAVTVIAPSTVPFEKTLGAEIGTLFQSLHESHGVEFRLRARVASLEGEPAEDEDEEAEGEGTVRAVVLEGGERIEADLVIVGIGVAPVTDWFEGVDRAPDGGVIVDRNLRAADSVYAAGDIASFPAADGGHQRIEHWRTALQQGRVAAHNMAGTTMPYESVPFFWTRQLGVGLMYVGHADRWDEILYQGDLQAGNFLAFYLVEERVVAVAGMNRARDMAAMEGLMIERRMPSPDLLREGAVDFPELLRRRP